MESFSEISFSLSLSLSLSLFLSLSLSLSFSLSLTVPIKITKMLQKVINLNLLKPNLIMKANYLQKRLVILRYFIVILQDVKKHSQPNIQIFDDNGTHIPD